MTVLVQDYEEGTNGTTITVANSAGTGENAVDTAVISSGNTEKYDTTTHLTSGSVALKHTVVSTSAGNCYWAWISTLGTQAQYYIRGYFKFDTAAGISLFTGLNGSTQTWVITTTSSGHIAIKAGVTTKATSTSTISPNTTIRIEAFIDLTSGAITCKIFIGGNSEGATPDETISFTGQSMGGQTSDTSMRVGPQNIANFSIWSDAIKMSTTGYVGAQNPTAPAVFAGGAVAATSTVSGSVATKHKISGGVNATSTVGGTLFKAGGASVPSTYGVGTYGVAIYGGSGAPPPTGIVGNVLATSSVHGAVNRTSATGPGGGIYTPPYTPPVTPPPVSTLGTFGDFAQAVYDDLNGELLIP